MILENARKYFDTPEDPNAKKIDPKLKRKPQDQGVGKGYQDFSCYHCGSKDHLIKDCPNRPAQPQGAQPRAPSKAQPPTKGKGQSKGKGKDGTKRFVPKAKSRSKNRPSAKGVEGEDDPDEPEDGDDDQQEPGEEQQETPAEEPEEKDEPWLETEPDEPEPQDDNASVKMVKTLLEQMKKYADAQYKEENTKPEISTLEVNDAEIPRITAQTSISTKENMVLLDGGASHNVYYSPSIPDGAIEKEVELAHGTKTGYVKGGDIMFLDESISEKKPKSQLLLVWGV